MPIITPADISNIIFRNGRLFVPKRIEKAIESSIESDVDSVREAGAVLIDKYQPTWGPINVDYSEETIIDAYTLFYTRRNTLIPRIALRDLVLNPQCRRFPSQIRVLDLGSGTGAVVLGLLDMFAHSPLSSMKIKVDAVDVAWQTLQRLLRLIKEAGLKDSAVEAVVLDLKDTSALGDELAQRANYDFIFAANVFNELSYDHSVDVLGCVAQHLSDNGVIIIADAQRDHVKVLLPRLVDEAQQMGLFLYYPCPPGQACKESMCWFWREHEYQYSTLKVRGKPVISSHREELVASWLILCNKPYSIYDEFRNQHPNLEWGVLSIYGDDSRIHDCQVCTPEGIQGIGKQAQSYKRGSIVGGFGDPFQISQYFEL